MFVWSSKQVPEHKVGEAKLLVSRIEKDTITRLQRKFGGAQVHHHPNHLITLIIITTPITTLIAQIT